MANSRTDNVVSVLVAWLLAGSGVDAWAATGEAIARAKGWEGAQHMAERVLAGRLAPSSGDSLLLVGVGSVGGMFEGSAGQLGKIEVPAGATTAFGSDAAIVRGLVSREYDALMITDPGVAQGQGRVSIYLGGPSFGSTPNLTIQGEAAGDLFGASVADIGDVNGDGFGDFAVGSPGYASGKGKVYVFLGGPSPSTTPALAFTGNAAGDLFGSAISAAGDVNGDGFPDFAVGSPGAQGGVGTVTIFRGGTSPSSTPLQTITGPVSPSYGQRPRFGSFLFGGKDLSGDGRPDLVVGAPGVAGERGSVYVYRDSAGVLGPAGQEFPGVSAFDHFGSSLSAAAFISDAANNLAVGAPGASEGRGTVSLFASAGGAVTPPMTVLTGTSPDDQFGYSLGAGRLFVSAPAPQLLIGAPFADSGTTAPNAGAAYFYAWPPALAVQERAVTVEADGSVLRANTYTSTRPRLVIRLSGADAVDTLLSHVTIDGITQKVTRILPPSGTRSGAKPASTQMAAAIVVPAVSLTEGPHVLRAYLEDQGHTVGGTVEVKFLAAERLRIVAPLVFPNPAPGSAKMRFTLTRPAAYELELYDVCGRRVDRLAQGQGLPEENELRFGRTANPMSPGVYFYVLSAAYQGQRASAKGRVVFLR